MASENIKSIVQMARGAIEERIDLEMSRILENVLDPNTKATAKRKLTVTFEIQPDDERKTLSVAATAKSALAPTNPVATALYVGKIGEDQLEDYARRRGKSTEEMRKFLAANLQ